MREIPGFYYDTERNRYFRIERGNSRANFVDSTQGADSSNSSSRSFHYDADTIRQIKKKKEETDNKLVAGENRLKACQIHLNDIYIHERIAQKISPLALLLHSRSHQPPNQISSTFAERFIKPYLPRLLKKQTTFPISLNTTSAMDCGFGYLLTGDRRGQIKLYDFSRPRDSYSQNQDIPDFRFREIYSFYQGGMEISAAKILSKETICLITRGGAGLSGEMIFLSSPTSFSVTDSNVFSWSKAPTSPSSLHCIARSENYIIAGGDSSFWMYQPVHSSSALHNYSTGSAVLSASFLPQPDTLHLGCRNGTILSYDLREPLRPQRFKRNDSLAIYKVLNYTPNYLISAEIGGKIAQWDIRHGSKPVQLFSGFKNSCDFNLGVGIHDLSATLTAAGDDNMIHHWSLSTGHEVSNPHGPFETTVSHIIPFSQDTLQPSNAEASSSILQDGYLMVYGNQMDIWTW